jgi:hypothetical protein
METTRTMRPRHPQEAQVASVPSRLRAVASNSGHATKTHAVGATIGAMEDPALTGARASSARRHATIPKPSSPLVHSGASAAIDQEQEASLTSIAAGRAATADPCTSPPPGAQR